MTNEQMKKLRIKLLKLFCSPSKCRVSKAIRAYNMRQISCNWAYQADK